MTQQRAPRAEPTPPLSEAELSRIAREAVHQPADPRLDRQLARMGVMDAPAPAKVRAELPSAPGATEQALERINGRLRRIEVLVGALVVIVAALSILTVIQLVR